MQPSTQVMRYRFADLTLDVGLRRVARAGMPLHLGKLTYEMLVALVEAAPTVVTQDQLVTRVWSGRITTPETVAQRAKMLRLALDDDTAHPRYLEVMRGQGYRLIPPVEREVEAEAQAVGELAVASLPVSQGVAPTHRRRAWLATGALLVAAGIGAAVWYARERDDAYLATAPAPAATAVKSIAVLPFADMSEDKNQQYIADGIAEEILDRLAKNRGGLRVIGRTSSFSFRNRPTRVPEIATTLNASHVLEGSVRRSGDRIRITVQLLEGAGATHLWSEIYDRKLGELFSVQDEIASAVAAALQVALAESSPGNRTLVSMESQEEFLRAKFFYERRAPGDFERTVKYLESAVARDPHFARAWELLSGAYSQMWWEGGLDAAIWIPRQGEAARRAVEADPELVEARIRLGQYYADLSDKRKAIEQFKEADEARSRQSVARIPLTCSQRLGPSRLGAADSRRAQVRADGPIVATPKKQPRLAAIRRRIPGRGAGGIQAGARAQSGTGLGQESRGRQDIRGSETLRAGAGDASFSCRPRGATMALPCSITRPANDSSQTRHSRD